MPPSAGACHTMDAAAKPDCGRAAFRSSIITAMGCRAATAGSTRRPVSGSGTVVGVGTGVGLGLSLGNVDSVGYGEAEPLDTTATGALGLGELVAATGVWPTLVRTSPRTSPPRAASPITPNVVDRFMREPLRHGPRHGVGPTGRAHTRVPAADGWQDTGRARTRRCGATDARSWRRRRRCIRRVVGTA